MATVPATFMAWVPTLHSEDFSLSIPLTFSPAPTGTFGTCGNGTLYGPGMTNLDLGISKNFLLTERYKIEFRSESSTLPTRPFQRSDTCVSPTMGRITSTQGARQIQFALKFIF